MNSRIKSVAALVFTAMICAGCWPTPQSMSSRYQILPQKPDGFAVSKRVLLVADNQLNHLYGDPVWLRNQLFDKVVNVTIRPVQQDLFGQEILRWILSYYGRRIPIVHLGDGTNLACAGEFARFREIMDSAGQPWVMAPGNHDAYFLGNLHTEDHDWWRQACARAEGPMHKDRFVLAYLEHLEQQHPDFAAYRKAHPDEGCWRGSGGREVFLRGVAWKVDRDKPYRSFVLQELDLRMNGSDLEVNALVLDSSQYAQAPTLIPNPPRSYNAGVSGSLLADQIALAAQWLGNSAADGAMTVLMIHHPYADLNQPSRQAVDGWRKKYRIPLYVSGHTHHGEYFVRGGDNGWLELNVGSTVDWPIEFRTFEIHEIVDDPENLVFRTPLFRIPDIWENAADDRKPQCLPVQWEIAQTDAGDFYLAHNYKSSLSPEKTQRELLAALLLTYRRMLPIVASAGDNAVWPDHCSSDSDVLAAIQSALDSNDISKMTGLLVQLQTFDEQRRVADPALQRDYRMCQAAWASKYDRQKGRKPVISNPFIQFPRKGE